MMTTAAILILLAHLIWIVLVIFGALFTRGRPLWSALHILSLHLGNHCRSRPVALPAHPRRTIL